MSKTLFTLLFTALFLLITPTAHAQIATPTPWVPWPCFPFTPCPSATPTPTKTIRPTPTPSLPSPTPSATPTATPSGGILFGAFVGSQPYTTTDIQNFEQLAGKKLAIVMWYQSHGVTDGTRNIQVSWMNNVSNRNSIPMVTLEMWDYTRGANQSRYQSKDIYNGNFDTYFHKFAQDSKAWGKPYFLRLNHEMNGSWYPWAESINGNRAGDYVKAWRHVVDIFRAEGATNVRFVWCPNVVYPGSTPLTQLFPGDEYVDWLCMDGYNWGDINGGWQDLTVLFTVTYNQLTALSSKPIMIGETASAEVGGSKAQWIRNGLGAGIDTMPNIKAINWFNMLKEKDWRINSTLSSLQAFQEVMANPKYLSNE